MQHIANVCRNKLTRGRSYGQGDVSTFNKKVECIFFFPLQPHLLVPVTQLSIT